MSDKELNSRQITILSFMSWATNYALKDLMLIFTAPIPTPSPATLRRDLSSLCDLEYLIAKGSRKFSVYSLTAKGALNSPLDPQQYCSIDIDIRSGNKSYNFDLFPSIKESLFGKNERDKLFKATEKYNKANLGASPVVRKKELERFIVELSWKSSKIEGNTYSLLDTERLPRDGIVAEGHSKEETSMILNHKLAFQYILNAGRISAPPNKKSRSGYTAER